MALYDMEKFVVQPASSLPCSSACSQPSISNKNHVYKPMEEELVHIGMHSIFYEEEIYHINAGPGSFSTRHFPTLEPYEEVDDDMSLSTSTTHDLPEPATIDEDQPRLDSYLTQLMQHVCTGLVAGADLVLHRALLDEEDLDCSYTICSTTKRKIHGGQLYFHLDTTNVAVPAPAMSGGTPSGPVIYHLTCLEALWQGLAFAGQLPSPIPHDKDWTSYSQASGRRTTCIHVTTQQDDGVTLKEEENQAPSVQYCKPVTAQSPPTHPNQQLEINSLVHKPSINLRKHIDRFQYLARYIVLGENVGHRHMAAIIVWQAASEMQFTAGEGPQIGVLDNQNVKKEKSGEENASLRACEDMIRLKALHCCSRDITSVINLMRWTQ